MNSQHGESGNTLPLTGHFFSRERMNLKAPIYFSTGLTEKANHYYKLFITWTNQKIRKTFVQRNMFEFKHIKAFDRAFADNPGPMVGGCWGGTRAGLGVWELFYSSVVPNPGGKSTLSILHPLNPTQKPLVARPSL